MTTYAGLYQSNLHLPAGAAYVRQQVEVKTIGGAIASLWADKNRVTPLTNPVAADLTGDLSFYADPAEYDILLSGRLTRIVVPPHPDEPTASTAYVDTVSSAKVAKGDLMISVRDFGAIGDGVTDDTAAICAAEAARAAKPTGAVLYFPPGTYLVRPTGDPTVKIAVPILGSNFELRGAGAGRSVVKMASGVGDYHAMFGPSVGATVLTGLTVRDITLDGNSAGNQITNNAPLFAGFPRYAVKVFSGQRLLIANCRFVNWDNVNTITLNASNATDVTIRDCVFDNVGANSNTRHDHSSVYVAAQRFEIAGCSFVGGGTSATTAIETHGGGQHVHHNRITGFFAGANITGVAAPGSIGVIVDHNLIYGAGIGLDLWSYLFTGNSTPWGMERVRLSNNIIEIDFDAWTAIAARKNGIALDELSTLGLRDVQILDNTIVYKGFSATPTSSDDLSYGIRLSRSVTYGAGDEGITIDRNTIIGPVAGGVYVNLKNTSTSRLHVTDNKVVNPGQNNAAAVPAAHKTGVLLVGVVADARVNRNTVIDDRGTAVANSGINTQFVTSATGCEAVDNVLRVADAGATVADYLGSATPAPFYVRHRTNKYAAISTPSLAGSAVLDGPNGILYTQTTSPSGTGWAAAPSSTPSAQTHIPKAGFYSTPPGVHSTIAGALNTMYLSPLWVGGAGTVTRIGAEVTTLQASSLVRLGIYADDGSGKPGALLVDAGTIDGSVAGAAELTLGSPLALTPGCYWLAAAIQGASGTLAVRALSGSNPPVGAGSLALAMGTATVGGYTMTGVSGALPSPFTFSSNTGAPPLVAVRWG